MSARPALTVEYEPRFCGTHAADVTVGCSFGCVYCPFADLAARRRGVERPTAVDLSGVASVAAPPSLFLSPASDPFAPQAVAGTQALLEHVLPQGTGVAFVTKGVIPDDTIELLAAHRSQIEGVGVGVTSLDDARNGLLEPGCPPARARLENLDRLAARGLPAALRMDPLFPLVDDEPAALEELVVEGARRGALAVTATYVFAWGHYLRRLRELPLLAESVALVTEKAPMEGGAAFSVPLARKVETYGRIAALAEAHGLWFNTCGCKDLRLRESGQFFSSCRNAFFPKNGLAAFTRSESRPAPAA